MPSTERPILNAIRELLRFKDHTTISEISKYTKLSMADVLKIINANGHLVYRIRKNGYITKVNPREQQLDQLWAEGKFFRTTSHDYGNTNGLLFQGHEALREAMLKETCGGGLGDSYTYKYIPDTPENRIALEKDGCTAFENVVLDDSLWVE